MRIFGYLLNKISSYTYTRLITSSEVEKFAKLSGDMNPIHIQGSQSIVHGTFLLSLVSATLGTKCPGPGTLVMSLDAKFLKPCYVDTEIEINVEGIEDRKITTCQYNCKNAITKEILCEGTAKLRIKR